MWKVCDQHYKHKQVTPWQNLNNCFLTNATLWCLSLTGWIGWLYRAWIFWENPQDAGIVAQNLDWNGIGIWFTWPESKWHSFIIWTSELFERKKKPIRYAVDFTKIIIIKYIFILFYIIFLYCIIIFLSLAGVWFYPSSDDCFILLF